MAGEENPNAALSAAAPIGSVPSIPGATSAVISPAGPQSKGFSEGSAKGLFPYETATNWHPWSAVAMTILIIALTVIVALGGSLVVLAATADSPLKDAINGQALIPMFLAQIVMAGGAVIAARAYGNRLDSALALKPPPTGLRSYATAFIAVLSAVGAFTVLAHYLFAHDLSEDLSVMTDLFRGPWWPLAIIVIGIGAPLSEELLFRGFLQTALVPTRLGYWGATLVTTTIWTAMHAGYSIIGLAEVFMIGMVFALILRRTGSLRVPIACHAIYNTSIALILIFTPKEILGF